MADPQAPDIPSISTRRHIQRILGAVGDRFVPADLDRDQLAADLSRAILGYEVRKLFQDPPSERDVQTQLKRLEEQVDRLYEQMPIRRTRLDWELLNILDNSEGAGHGFVARLCAHLCLFKTIVTRLREKSNAVITPRIEEPFGAEYWLFGNELPRTFTRHFRRAAGYSHLHTRKAGGPYVRFALAVGILLGVRKSTGRPYGGGTIAKALTAYRKLGKEEQDRG